MLNMVDWRSSLLLLIFFVYGGLGDVQFQWKFHPTVNPVVKDGKRSGESMSTPSTILVPPKRPPTGTAFPISANSDCEDNPSVNCSLYNTDIICDSQGIYYLWARKNCRLHCGFCQKSCKDDPNANCALYNATALCDPNGIYYGWARRNCTAYCGLCQGTTTSLQPTVITSSQPSYPSEVCKDTLNCRVYHAAMICVTNGIYYPWSLKHCPAYCGYCQAPTRIVPCSDKLTNCDEYPPDLCTNELYRLWREDNCRKFCGICSGIDTVTDYSSVVG